MGAKLTAEFIGTFWLVLGGCGSAVLAAAFPDVGIGLLGVSLAFGLTVVTGAYALRADLRRPLQSGGFGRAVGGRALPGRRSSLPYIVAQVLGASPAPPCCTLIATRQAGVRAGAAASPRTATASTRPASYSLSRSAWSPKWS